jgi:hypothetical protein
LLLIEANGEPILVESAAWIKRTIGMVRSASLVV